MTKVIFSSLTLSSTLICADMTLEELQKENQKLQLQLKNAQIKQQLKEMEGQNTTPPPKNLA